jgi:hypothetical protein
MRPSRRAAIEKLLSRYTWATDSNRFDDLKNCFAPDGFMQIEYQDGRPHIRLRGPTEIVSWIATQRSGQTHMRRRHMTSNLIIEETNDGSATAISYVMLLVISDGKIRVTATGEYRDLIVERDGQWEILERTVSLDAANA